MKSRVKFALLLLCLTVSASGQKKDAYSPALPGYFYKFPHDHFSHPDYQTEWWYYTGNLVSDDGHNFGFELTFFRQGVSRDADKTSPWDVRDLYFAHFALSDVDGKRFYHTERINRAGPGVAGVSEPDEEIWNGNWRVHLTPEGQDLEGISEKFSVRLHLSSKKPAVIHGANGVSQKAQGEGHASHYISFTRLLSNGRVELNGKNYQVHGHSWMDHEFFTHQLDPDQVGWDWLSLQFDDNTELMLYRIRHKDGSVDPYSSGTYVDENGTSTPLGLKDYSMRPLGKVWTSDESHGTYPIDWEITVPKLGITAAIETPLKPQEIVSSSRGAPSYWEGVIDILGTRKGAALAGKGYLEMTGYASAVSFGQ